MLNRDTDLTEHRLFHNKVKIPRTNKALSYVKLNLFGSYDFIDFGDIELKPDDGIGFQVLLTKIGLVNSERCKSISKILEHNHCDKCGREFSILGKVDKHKYCIPSGTSFLCTDCDKEISQKNGTQEFIEKILKIKRL